MSRIVLGIVAAISIIWGIWMLIPAWAVSGSSIPAWMSWSSIIVGVVAAIIAISDTKE